LLGQDRAGQTAYLEEVRTAYPVYRWLAVLDRTGRVVAATNPQLLGRDMSDRPWFRTVRDRGTIDVLDLQPLLDTAEEQVVGFSAPIKGPRGEFLGAVTSRVGLLVLTDVFARTLDNLQANRGGRSRIEWQFITRDGDLIADSVHHQEGQVNLKYLGLPSALLTASAQSGFIEETHSRRGVEVVTGYAQTQGYGDFTALRWGVLVRMEKRDILAPVKRVMGRLGLAGTVVFLPMLGLLLWSTMRLKREWAAVQTETAHAKAAEAALLRQAEELQRSNADLEQFAYVASHDLQEPLRMVASYCQLLQRRYRDQLDASAGEFIGYAVDGAKRMQELINDLLNYSRVGTQAKPFELTDCEGVLRQVLVNLKVAVEEARAVITHDPLPTVWGDRVQIQLLVQNLVGNAIKYRGERPPEVHLAAVQEDGAWRFSVRDNGIGIDPQFADRIFVMFQRLHSREEFAGTGIGLAICKKIVERHGGRIWVESVPGRGSEFFFTCSMQGGPDGPAMERENGRHLVG
jgi:signal transduction histidine kinase